MKPRTAFDQLLSFARSPSESGWVAIDVRSPGEFAQLTFPHFKNLPILNDSERHQVGLTYKTQGQDSAVTLGHELVSGETKGSRIEGWRRAIGDKQALVTCWRGGMRSRLACEWIDLPAQVHRIEGGTKALRQVFLEELASPPSFHVISGRTGSGKTELLTQLAADKIDLEDLAKHRGSAFGRRYRDPQPTQGTFENLLAFEFARHRHARAVWVEDESRRIGNVQLPELTKETMTRAPCLMIEESIQNRAIRIFKDYVESPIQKEVIPASEVYKSFQSALERIRPKLGGLRYQQISNQLVDGFSTSKIDLERHTPWITSLLNDYYDPLYDRVISKYDRPILFRGNWLECQDRLHLI